MVSQFLFNFITFCLVFFWEKNNQSNFGLLIVGLIPVQDSDGNDTAPCTIRAAIHSVEQAGTVDFELAGHSCNRPPEVCQGSEEEDRPVFQGVRVVNRGSVFLG